MLEGKIGLVTGGGQGIGQAIAVEMARQGAAAVAIADRDLVNAEQTAASIRDAGGVAEAIHVDVRDGRQVAAMVAHVAVAFGGLDVLFNNAGIIERSLTAETAVDTLPEDVWDTVLEINLRGVWLATKYAAPHLARSSRGPAIVNMASTAGLTGYPQGPAYCAAKGGVIQLTRASAVDLAPIRCNCIAPGTIDTPMSRQALDAADDRQAARRAMVAPQLVERFGTPDEVAGLACFLASDHAGFVTGAVLPVDGGALAWIGAGDHGTAGA